LVSGVGFYKREMNGWVGYLL